MGNNSKCTNNFKDAFTGIDELGIDNLRNNYKIIEVDFISTKI